jgi:hypothetical protein
MLINIMVATVAADPTVTLKPRDHVVPLGFRLRRWRSGQIYAHRKILSSRKYAINCATTSCRVLRGRVSCGYKILSRSDAEFTEYDDVKVIEDKTKAAFFGRQGAPSWLRASIRGRPGVE